MSEPGNMAGAVSPLKTIHVGFTERDLDRSVAMFVDLFGYTVESRGPRHPKGVQLLTGVADADLEVAHLAHPDLLTVELIQYVAGAAPLGPPLQPNEAGYTHLNYQVEDIDNAVEAAARHGAALIGRIVSSSRDPANNRRVAYLRAPDGIHLEFVQSVGADPAP